MSRILAISYCKLYKARDFSSFQSMHEWGGRVVRSFKDVTHKQSTSSDINLHIVHFLLAQNYMPRITTGVTLTELLISRKLTINIGRLRPDLVSQVRHQYRTDDDGRVIRSFAVNESMLFPHYSTGDVMKTLTLLRMV